MLSELEKKLASQICGYEQTKPAFENHLMNGGNPQLIRDMQEYLEFIGVFPIPDMPYLLCRTQDYLARAVASDMVPTYDKLSQWFVNGNIEEMRATLLELGVTAAKNAEGDGVIHLAGIILLKRGFNPLA